jgi:hypothetical protein
VCRVPLPGGERGLSAAAAAAEAGKAARGRKKAAAGGHKPKEGARTVWLKIIEAAKEVVEV